MSPTDLLERAIAAIDEALRYATPGPWWNESGVIHAPLPGRPQGPGESGPCVHPLSEGNGVQANGDAEYAALMHPPVAAGVRDVLAQALPQVRSSEHLGMIAAFGWQNMRYAPVVRLAALILREKTN